MNADQPSAAAYFTTLLGQAWSPAEMMTTRHRVAWIVHLAFFFVGLVLPASAGTFVAPCISARAGLGFITPPVSVLMGMNTITVYGTNAAGLVSTDCIAVQRAFYNVTPGRLVGWGNNNYGQTNCPAGSNYVAVVAGVYHSLALRSNGTLAGWGRNWYGQTNCPAGSNYIAVAAGDSHSLALRSNGTLAGWGGNWYGQTNCPAGSNYIAVAAGDSHSLALRNDGTVVGWGYNWYGQTNCPAGSNYIAVAAGDSHSLALRNDGTVVGWGGNWYGQTYCLPGTNFVAIAAGGYHSLALRNDGTVVGWGYNGSGQTDCPAGTNYTAIAAGSYHSHALRSDGMMMSWGNNSDGQMYCPPGSKYFAVAAGGYHSLGIALPITNEPVVSLAPGNVNVSIEFGSATSFPVRIFNAGTTTAWRLAEPMPAWLTANMVSGMVGCGDSVVVKFTVTNVWAVGAAAFTSQVQNSGVDQPILSIGVTTVPRLTYQPAFEDHFDVDHLFYNDTNTDMAGSVWDDVWGTSSLVRLDADISVPSMLAVKIDSNAPVTSIRGYDYRFPLLYKAVTGDFEAIMVISNALKWKESAQFIACADLARSNDFMAGALPSEDWIFYYDYYTAHINGANYVDQSIEHTVDNLHYRVVRSGNTFRSFSRTDWSGTWRQFGAVTHTATLPDVLSVGPGVAEHSATGLTHYVDYFSISVPQPTPGQFEVFPSAIECVPGETQKVVWVSSPIMCTVSIAVLDGGSYISIASSVSLSNELVAVPVIADATPTACVCRIQFATETATGIVTVTRWPEYAGPPHVAITSSLKVVSLDTTAQSVVGTNNQWIVGDMWVSNATIGGAATSFARGGLDFTTPQVQLQPGVNAIRVYGTNVLGFVSDSVVVVSRASTSDYVWINAEGGSWTNGVNWSAGLIAGATGKRAYFSMVNLATDCIVTLDTNPTVGHLVFDDPLPGNNWTINAGSPAGTLRLAVSSEAPTVDVGSCTATIGALIRSTNGLVKTGSGTLVLSAENPVTGATIVAAGTLAVAGQNNPNGALTPSDIVINTGGTLLVKSANALFGWGGQYLGPYGSYKSITVNTGGTLTNSDNAPVHIGAVNLVGGTFASGVPSSYWGTWTIHSNVAVTESSIIGAKGLILLKGSSFNVASNKSLLVNGTIAYNNAESTSQVTKNGLGAMILSGANTYPGLTTVNGGTLLVNGTNSGTGVVTMNTNGTLGGNGIIGGIVTNWGTVAPGSGGLGVLTACSNVVMRGTGVILMEINRSASPSSDKLIVQGSLTFGGRLIVTNTGSGLQYGDTFDLFDGTNKGVFSTVVLPPLSAELRWNTNNLASQGVIAVGAIPPYVNITNLEPVLVDLGQAGVVSVAGTNNEYVVGGMWISNTANNAVAGFLASAAWISAPVALGGDTNIVYVYGTNTAGVLAIDNIVVIGTPEPSMSGVAVVIACSLLGTRRKKR